MGPAVLLAVAGDERTMPSQFIITRRSARETVGVCVSTDYWDQSGALRLALDAVRIDCLEPNPVQGNDHRIAPLSFWFDEHRMISYNYFRKMSIS